MPYLHARRMTVFVDGGAATPSPAELSPWRKVLTLLGGVRVPRPSNESDPGAVGLAFSTVRFESGDGVPLEGWYVPADGDAPLVVGFHGYADSKESLLPETRVLHQLGAAVLLVDFRGSGGSAGRRTSLGWYEAEDVAGAVRYARRELRPERVLPYGASMGAAAVCRAVGVLGVRADAVLLESPFDRMLDTVGNRFRQMGLPPFPLARALVFWGGFQQGFDAFEHDPQDYVAGIDCPTLCLFGALDRDVTLADADAFLARAGSNVRRHVFTGAGHARLYPQQPAEWRRVVADFLDGLR